MLLFISFSLTVVAGKIIFSFLLFFLINKPLIFIANLIINPGWSILGYLKSF